MRGPAGGAALRAGAAGLALPRAAAAGVRRPGRDARRGRGAEGGTSPGRAAAPRRRPQGGDGEAPGRSAELSAEVAALREELEPMLDDPPRALEFLQRECAVPPAGAEQMVAYLGRSRDALGALPTQKTLIAERFFDEAGGMQL